MKKIFIAIFCFFLLCTAIDAAPNYKIISTEKDLLHSEGMALRLIGEQFGITIKLPIKCTLKKIKEIDRDSSLPGGASGLYQFQNGTHVIYVEEDLTEDTTIGILAHELTHAWQEENAPPAQDQLVKEGFARWIQYNTLYRIGAYNEANILKDYPDPIYGVGLKKVFEIEDKIGKKNVLDHMRTLVKFE